MHMSSGGMLVLTVVSLCHGSNLSDLRDTAYMSNVWLENVNGAICKTMSYFQSRENGRTF